MAIPLGNTFFTDENVVAQANVQLLKKIVESLIDEFNQGKFEKFLSSGSASPKTTWQYRKVSSETCSRISSEISPKVARTTGHSVNGATSNEVLNTFHASHAVCVNVSQETRRANASVHYQSVGEDQFLHLSPL